MLIDFRIKNYRSYRDEAEFSFEALDNDFLSDNFTEVDLEGGDKIRLLKSAAIFGANASGKSNIIWALFALQDLVANSLNLDVNTPIRSYIPYMFDSESKNQPTRMEIGFVLKNKRYRYAIEFTNWIVGFEALYVYINGNEQVVYKLDDNRRRFVLGDGWTGIALDVAFGELLSNQLLISALGKREANGLQEVYSFLATMHVKPIGDVIDLKANNYEVANNILKNKDTDLFGKLRELVRIADMGVEDLLMQKHREDEFNFPESVSTEIRQAFIRENQWEFGTIHEVDGKRFAFPMELESVGTKQIFSVGARVLNVLENGGILVYDEMNTAIHSELFRLLVSLFNNKETNPHNAQLLFTTHDVSVASSNTLRADQIWFAEKEDSVSQLYSAQDFTDIGINVPFEQWYRSGRFGARPDLKSINPLAGRDGKKAENNARQ